MVLVSDLSLGATQAGQAGNRNTHLCLQGMTALQLAVAGRHAEAIEILIRRTPGFKADAECRQVSALLLHEHCSVHPLYTDPFCLETLLCCQRCHCHVAA